MMATRSGVSVMGLLLVALGVVLLLQTTGLVSSRIWVHLIRLWPLALILMGLHALIGQRWPYLMAAITAGFLIAAISGAAILNSRDGGANIRSGNDASGTVSADNRIDMTVIFGGSERRITSQAFKGGEVTSIFGNAELDLRDAKLDSSGSRLELVAVMGSVEVTVPKGWNVVVEGAPVFGSLDDQQQSREDLPGSPRLEVDATAVFGAVTVKD